MAFPSTFKTIQDAVLIKARLDISSAALDTPKVKDWINQTYFQVCIETEAIVNVLAATLIASTSRYSLATTAVGVNALNSATVNVVDTTFATSGSFYLNGVLVTYTGKTATTFTGCGNHAATVGGELITSSLGRLKTLYVTPFGQTQTQPPLVLTTIDDLINRRLGSGATALSGQWPLYYALLGINDFEVWPTPAAADVLNIFYAAFPTPLVADTDVSILEEPYGSKLLEYGALVQGGDLLGDPATDEWQNDYDLWMQRYLNHLEQKKGDLPVQFHQWGSLADTRALYGGW